MNKYEVGGGLKENRASRRKKK